VPAIFNCTIALPMFSSAPGPGLAIVPANATIIPRSHARLALMVIERTKVGTPPKMLGRAAPRRHYRHVPARAPCMTAEPSER
jgi:hypothetical protein